MYHLYRHKVTGLLVIDITPYDPTLWERLQSGTLKAMSALRRDMLQKEAA